MLQGLEIVKADVDVAAVRRQALEDACNVIDGYSEYDQSYCCSGHMCGCYGATVHQQMQHFIRALSANLAQGEQWQPIETAPKDGTEILVWSEAYNGRWVFARWDEDKNAKKPTPRWIADGAAYERRTLITFPPTHWMPLPAAPTSEAGQ